MNEYEIILKARELIEKGRYSEARSLLTRIPESPVAQEWLLKLNEVAPVKASQTGFPDFPDIQKKITRNNITVNQKVNLPVALVVLAGFLFCGMIGFAIAGYFLFIRDDEANRGNVRLGKTHYATFLPVAFDYPEDWYAGTVEFDEFVISNYMVPVPESAEDIAALPDDAIFITANAESEEPSSSISNPYDPASYLRDLIFNAESQVSVIGDIRTHKIQSHDAASAYLSLFSGDEGITLYFYMIYAIIDINKIDIPDYIRAEYEPGNILLMGVWAYGFNLEAVQQQEDTILAMLDTLRFDDRAWIPES